MFRSFKNILVNYFRPIISTSSREFFLRNLLGWYIQTTSYFFDPWQPISVHRYYILFVQRDAKHPR